MQMRKALLIAVAVCTIAACGTDPSPVEVNAPAPAPSAEPAPAILEHPFTAEQIRDEWIPGLTLVMKTDSPEGGALERWTVVAAAAEGVEIRFQQIDAGGNPAGEPRVTRSGWAELRDHAKFPADRATREEVTRDTALGELEGWLYRVTDEAAGTVTEFFFATSLAGAPVEMRVTRDGQPVMALAQIERQRPASP